MSEMKFLPSDKYSTMVKPHVCNRVNKLGVKLVTASMV